MIFSIIGGDERARRLAGQLLAEGHTVRLSALEVTPPPEGAHCCESFAEAADGADCVILPLPMCSPRGYLNAPLASEAHCIGEVISALSPGTTVCAGMPDRDSLARAERLGVRILDYYEREELLAKNAVATAEGALAVILGETERTISGRRALILGHGRLGRALAPRLKALGAEVTVASRSAGDMAWTEAEGYHALHTARLEGELAGFEIVINTVPSLLLDCPRLAELPPGALVLELASAPGGVDMDSAAMLGLRALRCPGLPGKWSPESAAEAVRDAVFNILIEEMEEHNEGRT